MCNHAFIIDLNIMKASLHIYVLLVMWLKCVICEYMQQLRKKEVY